MAMEITTGSVSTTGRGTFTITAFYRRRDNDRDFSLQDADKDVTCEIKAIPPVEVNQSSASHRGNNRTWVTRRGHYPNGSLIRFVIQEMSLNMDGRPKATQRQLIISPREEAALLRIGIDLPTDQFTTRPVLYIVGRFDILSVQEVIKRKLHLAKSGADESSMYASANFKDGFHVSVLEKEIAAKVKAKAPVVVNVGERKKVMPVLRRTRRINTTLND